MSYSEPDDGGRTRDEQLAEEAAVAEEARLESILVPHADGPDELTLYPAGVTDATIMTRWMTAQEGAYVSLEDWR
ncbi:hypothetical protein ACFR9U_12745 [Halorientalis brevis]|uniref:DUF7511 domain-containing protein n=1 Tax=Halorientalis brevis TaxID=1126241 RepID=A0ABD6CDW8_9EURY|nr:hypothetical protein [Halorientalis brevis]